MVGLRAFWKSFAEKRKTIDEQVFDVYNACEGRL